MLKIIQSNDKPPPEPQPKINMPTINKSDYHKDRAGTGKGDLHRRTPGSVDKYRNAPIWKKMGTKFNKSPQTEIDFHFEKP